MHWTFRNAVRLSIDQTVGEGSLVESLPSLNFNKNFDFKDREIKSLALEIVSLVSRNKDCVNEIAACEILGHFLVSLRDTELKEMQDRVLETLSGLLNVQKMVKEAQSKGSALASTFITTFND